MWNLSLLWYYAITLNFLFVCLFVFPWFSNGFVMKASCWGEEVELLILICVTQIKCDPNSEHRRYLPTGNICEGAVAWYSQGLP